MVFNQLQEFLGLLQSISSVRSCRHVGESMLFCNQCTCHVLNLQSPTDMPELYAAKVVWNCEVVMSSVDNSFRGSKVNIRWQSSQRHPGCFIYPVQDIYVLFTHSEQTWFQANLCKSLLATLEVTNCSNLSRLFLKYGLLLITCNVTADMQYLAFPFMTSVQQHIFLNVLLLF